MRRAMALWARIGLLHVLFSVNRDYTNRLRILSFADYTAAI